MVTAGKTIMFKYLDELDCKGANLSNKSENFLIPQLSPKSRKFYLPRHRNVPSFRLNGAGENFSNLEKSKNFLGIFAFHFFNFFENFKIIFIRACKCANFQTDWRKWKFLQFNQMNWNI